MCERVAREQKGMASVAVRPQNRAPSANMFSVKKLIRQNPSQQLCHCTLLYRGLPDSMRVPSGRLRALGRRKAIARRRNAFVARGDRQRIAAGANERSGSVDDALHKPARVLRRNGARGDALSRIGRMIAAPLQRHQDQENADRAFGEKDQTRLLQNSSTAKRHLAAGLTLRKRAIGFFALYASAIN
ncbi:MAG: hypothetical protein ACR65X_03800 [Methylocystis sp.]